jgi:hypothetical protein
MAGNLKFGGKYSPRGAVIIGQLRQEIIERDSVSAGLLGCPSMAFAEIQVSTII